MVPRKRGRGGSSSSSSPSASEIGDDIEEVIKCLNQAHCDIICLLRSVHGRTSKRRKVNVEINPQPEENLTAEFIQDFPEVTQEFEYKHAMMSEKASKFIDALKVQATMLTEGRVQFKEDHHQMTEKLNEYKHLVKNFFKSFVAEVYSTAGWSSYILPELLKPLQEAITELSGSQ